MKKAISVLIPAALLSTGLAVVSSALSVANAAQLNLTSQGASGSINGALFEQISNGEPAGTGVINSFLRIQSPGNSTVEAGYNTDARPLEFDENNSPQFTRSLLFSDVSIVNIDGKDYRQFILDLNEPNAKKKNPDAPNIILDDLQIFLGNAPDLTGFNTTDFANNTTKIFDLDAGGDNSVLLRDRNSGSGRYDYLVSIENSKFENNFVGTNQYLYLYSKFSNAEGGFEEWATKKRRVPEPATLTGLALLGGAMAFLRRRRSN
ncbi:MAG: PEP-CTERM sorting domain-containing protein [Nostocaceae cyanobacterium]|nr:PEP-CTERM sorting domain-containing protein [Nostocaceae cyanobacterium]